MMSLEYYMEKKHLIIVKSVPLGYMMPRSLHRVGEKKAYQLTY